MKDIDKMTFTEYMLEINGLTPCKFHNGYYFDLRNGERQVYVGPIFYIGELKMALRLCELDEIADNFKIRL